MQARRIPVLLVAQRMEGVLPLHYAAKAHPVSGWWLALVTGTSIIGHSGSRTRTALLVVE